MSDPLTRSHLPSAVCKALSLCALSVVVPSAWPEETPTPEQLAAWAQQLGDESFDKRNEAEECLQAAGAMAKDALEKAVRSEDLERRQRAKRLLDVLRTAPILDKMAAALAAAGHLELELTILPQPSKEDLKMKGHCRCHADGKRFVLDVEADLRFMKTTIHGVCDGQTVWSEASVGNATKRTVRRTSLAAFEQLGDGGVQPPIQNLRSLRKLYSFTDFREETLGDAEYLVLNGELRTDVLEKMAKTAEELRGKAAAQAIRLPLERRRRVVVYVRKSDYLIRKTEFRDVDDSPVICYRVDSLKRLDQIDEQIFTYTPPADAEVRDSDGGTRNLPEPQPRRPAGPSAVEHKLGE